MTCSTRIEVRRRFWRGRIWPWYYGACALAGIIYAFHGPRWPW